MPSVSAPAVLAALLPLSLLACSGKSDPPAARPLAPLLPITAVEPPPASTVSSYRSPVVVTFGEDLETATEADFEVRDGLGPLAGIRDYDVARRTWTWTPVHELPRGAHLTAVVGTGVRGRLGGELPAPYTWTFDVRDGELADVVDLDGVALSTPVFPCAGRDGTAAVAAGTWLHEWSHGGVTSSELGLLRGRFEGCTADSTGGLAGMLAASGPNGFELVSVRRPAGGSWQFDAVDARPMVLGLLRLHANAQGGLACYWYAAGGTAAGADALWTTASVAATWTPQVLPTAPAFTVRGTLLDNLGDFWHLHADPQAGTLEVGRLRPTNGAVNTRTLPVLPSQYAFGVDGQGRAQVVVEAAAGNDQVLWWYRGDTISGFAAPREVARGDQVGLVDLRVAECGEAVLLYQSGAGLLARRLDADGGLGEPSALAVRIPPSLAVSPRGEAWLVQWVPLVATPAQVALTARRWRAGGVLEAARTLATQSAAGIFGRTSVAVDASGRAVVAWVSGPVGSGLRLQARRFE